MAGSVAGLAKTQLESDGAGVEARSDLRAVWRHLSHCTLLPLALLSQLKKKIPMAEPPGNDHTLMLLIHQSND